MYYLRHPEYEKELEQLQESIWNDDRVQKFVKSETDGGLSFVRHIPGDMMRKYYNKEYELQKKYGLVE